MVYVLLRAERGQAEPVIFLCRIQHPYGVYHFQWNTQYYYFH